MKILLLIPISLILFGCDKPRDFDQIKHGMKFKVEDSFFGEGTCSTIGKRFNWFDYKISGMYELTGACEYSSGVKRNSPYWRHQVKLISKKEYKQKLKSSCIIRGLNFDSKQNP